MDLKILMVCNVPVNIRTESHGLMSSEISFASLVNFRGLLGVKPHAGEGTKHELPCLPQLLDK